MKQVSNKHINFLETKEVQSLITKTLYRKLGISTIPNTLIQQMDSVFMYFS